jgi:hypothetical protein
MRAGSLSPKNMETRHELCYLLSMTKLEKIEHDITSLQPAELHKLADWLAEYRAEMWDKEIQADSKAGKLDKLFAEAEADIAAGKVRPF